MKLIKSILSTTGLFLSLSVTAQITISGKVVDSATQEPLAGTSVFAQNTTFGTVTNKDGEFSLTLRAAGYDLIFSYTGYQSYETRITEEKSQELQIQMIKEDKNLGEVIIQSSNEVKDGWEKYGDFFISHFIGATPFAAKCALENPDVVHFYYYKKADKLKVKATEPLIISNDALGYELRYNLDSFVYYYQNELSSYRGSCFFTEKLGTIDQALQWKANREKAYYGSKLHFIRSYYNMNVAEQGFTVDILGEGNGPRFGRITRLYDTAYYYASDSLEEAELYFPRKISVTYVRAVPESEYLEQYKLPMDVGVQISYIDLLNPIGIKKNGYYYDQRDWINQGYWSWKNLADLLPYNYSPNAYDQY
jgi:CarboxypepD_reg-like domain